MCLYPRKLQNKKYTATEKNGGCIPSLPVIGYGEGGWEIHDMRVQFIEVPCGQCIECRQTKAREWQVRLAEEIKAYKYNYFVTLTFSPEQLVQLKKKTRLNECNALAGYAVRHMLERWRKDHKKSIKHWFITELGHEGTERIHLHGLLFNNEPLEFGAMDDNNLRTWKYWKYGHIFVGQYVNNRTINYISKYITKIDTDHKGFIGQILASPGIGGSFITKYHERGGTTYVYRPKDGADFYRLENGCKVKLPRYYKNKLYNEEERELMWREFMDKDKISIMGTEHSIRTTGEKSLERIKDNAKDKNKFLGYGDDSGEWRKREYNITQRMLESERKKNDRDEIVKNFEKNMQKMQKFLAHMK